ncbi:MAG: hypothetical protein PHP62_06130, partial [Candidatus Moranbacteria bacterium]|nr:hypothetical protein [Candidatus Moranbacteria bacterium]
NPDRKEIAEALHNYFCEKIEFSYTPNINRVMDPWKSVTGVNQFIPMNCLTSAALMVQCMNMAGFDDVFVRFFGATKGKQGYFSKCYYKTVDGLQYQIYIQLKKKEILAYFDFDAACCVLYKNSGVIEDTCYIVSMQNKAIKGDYLTLRKPDSILIERYLWVFVEANGSCKEIHLSGDYEDPYKYWLDNPDPTNETRPR